MSFSFHLAGTSQTSVGSVGPAVGDGACATVDRDGFDFILLFEQSVGPNVLLLLTLPFRWFNCGPSPGKQGMVRNGSMETGERWAVLFCIMGFVLL
jgi:hypothetical protein